MAVRLFSEISSFIDVSLITTSVPLTVVENAESTLREVSFQNLLNFLTVFFLDKISSENSRSLQKAPTVCRDKHSISFCRRFKASGMGKYSCSDAEFAVRVCRHSCGYCNDELYSMKNAPALCADSNKNIPIINGTHLYWAFGRDQDKKKAVWYDFLLLIVYPDHLVVYLFP